MSNQHNVSVKYEDKEGVEHTLNLTLKKPGFMMANRINDLINVGEAQTNWGAIFELLMQDVIVKPNWSYKVLDKMIADSKDKELLEHVVVDKNDSKNKLTLRFPTNNGFRLSIATGLMVSSAYNGKLNYEGFLANLMKYFIVNPDDKEKIGVDEDYFDTNYDFGNQVMAEAGEWLGKIANYQGTSAALIKAYTFLSE